MEHQTEFNLGEAIQQYITLLNDSSILRQNELEELADHLHLESQSLVDSGLSEREGFEVSKIRFGCTDEIKDEFKKSKPSLFIWHNLMLSILFYCLVRISVLASFVVTFAMFHGKLSDLEILLRFSLKPVFFVLIFGFLIFLIHRRLNRTTTIVNMALPLSAILLILEIITSGGFIHSFNNILFGLSVQSHFMMLLVSVMFLVTTSIFKIKDFRRTSSSLATS